MKGGAAYSDDSDGGSGSKSESGSGSGSGSGSDSSSGSSSSDLGKSGVTASRKPGGRPSSSSKPDWKNDPELYGIRRSSRVKEVPDLNNSYRSDTDEEPQPKKRKPAPKRKASTQSSDSEEDDSSDFEKPKAKKKTRKPPPKKKPVKKKKAANSDYSDESEYDARRPKRTRGGEATASDSKKKPSYVIPDTDEDVSEDDVQEWTIEGEEEVDLTETVEKVMDHRKGLPGATGPATTVYTVASRGDPNTEAKNQEDEDLVMQYLIKWKGYSHLHNTWESDASLKIRNAKGMKKVENYVKKIEDYDDWKKYSTPEDIEYAECQLEMQQQLMGSYTTVERIVDMQWSDKDAEYPDYYVKWSNLPYSDATWENGQLIEEDNQEQIMQFKVREESKFTPSRSNKVLKYRPKFHEEKEQPDFIGSGSQVMRDYQMEGVNWLVHAWTRHNSCILADEMGLGKTIQSISFLYYLFHKYQLYGPFLVVVPLSTLDAWRSEFSKWAPDMNVLTYIGDVTSRTIIRSREWVHPGNKRTKFNVLLATYEIVLKDKAELQSIAWAGMVVDEAHRLKNAESLLYKCLENLDTNHRVLVTGTPLQNTLKELWCLLHFIMPLKFDDWESFNEEYGSNNALKRGYARLHKHLEPFILRRIKKDVEKSLPSKVEQILRVDMSKLQKQYYKFILTKNYKELTKDNHGSIVSFVNIMMELKKCCNHAYLTKPPLDIDAGFTREERLQKLLRGSGKLLLLDKLLVRLQETGHRVLIFSQMVRMLDILVEYLELRRFKFQRIDGGIKGDLRKNAIDHFNAPDSQDFCFLLSTRAGGLGINLATADTVIIFDSDWNPQNDLQAQARAHRIGQKSQVNIYRLVTGSSVEEDIVERAKKKMVLDHLVIQRMDTTGRMVFKAKEGGSDKKGQPFSKNELSAILKFGAEELFKDEDEEGGGGHDDCDIDEILRRAETREGEDASGMCAEGDELLSAFKVASLAVNEDEAVEMATKEAATGGGCQKLWDDIIPQDLRKQLEEEEKEKELSELYLGPRVRKTVLGNDDENKENEGNKKKRKKGSDGSKDGSKDGSDESSEDEESDEESPPKKKYKKSGKLHGFKDGEVRRFIKSYKKFPLPMTRMESIAMDSDLTEKPVSQLIDLARTIREACVEALHTSDGEETPSDKAQAAKKKIESVKIGNKVMVNPKTLMETESLLRPLGKLMPGSEEERLEWRLNSHVKDAHFDVEWGIVEDSRLLLGIYQHGLGSWEQVKLDRDLELSDKMLLNANCKPQSKHLDLRAAYLLRVLAKSEEKVSKGKRSARKSLPNTKAKEEKEESTKEYKSVAIIENSDSSDSDSEKKELKEKKEKVKEPKEKKEKKPKAKRQKTAAELGPIHITGSKEPVLVGELDPAIFAQCKEKMRSVKKALKALDKPDPNMSQDEQVIMTRKCLIKIGTHIDKVLGEMKEEKAKEWRSNLWFFVSKFTEFEATKLYKLYRHAVKKEGRGKKDDDDRGDKKEKHRDKKRKEDREHKKSHKSHHHDRSNRNSVDDHDGKSKDRTIEKSNDRLVDKTNDRLQDTTNDRSYGRYEKADRSDRSSQNRSDRSSHQKSGYDRTNANDRMGHGNYNGYDKGGYQERSGYNKSGYHQGNRHNNSGGRGGGYKGSNWRGRGGGYNDRGYEDRGYGGDGWKNRDRQYSEGYRNSSTVIDSQGGGYREGGGGAGYRENEWSESYHDMENGLSRDASESQI